MSNNLIFLKTSNPLKYKKKRSYLYISKIDLTYKSIITGDVIAVNLKLVPYIRLTMI